ncbi:hypothetical protein LIER_09121 [Lithospermum erythrorhizon]|uniref:Uncharacterized protein n=1 Tax=Lithospermum erythrorhizon TaxID=34254 RepID=A0AAV3PIF9_LITER
MLSDPMENHSVDPKEGCFFLREELNAPFPHKASALTSTTRPPVAIPEEEICHRKGKAPMLAYDRNYLETPFQLAKEKGAAQEAEKSWVVEKAVLVSERDALQIRCKELEKARAADELRATEALFQAKK